VQSKNIKVTLYLSLLDVNTILVPLFILNERKSRIYVLELGARHFTFVVTVC